MSYKLTDTQQQLLKAAAARGDRCLVLPPSLKGGAAYKVAAKLIAAGLVKEVRATSELSAWRRDEGAGLPYSLKLTAAGAKAIANDQAAIATEPQAASGARKPAVAAAPVPLRKVVNPDGPVSVAPPRGDTKIALVVGLMQRRVGATLDELVASTGWLPHTTRAALTGLRRRGYAVSIDRSDRERGSTYRIGIGEKPEDAKVPARDDVPSETPRRSNGVEGATVRQARKAA